MWAIPGTMALLWSQYYTEIFLEPRPGADVAETVVHCLMAINLVAVGMFIYLSRANDFLFLLACVMVAIELPATFIIWDLASLSLSGFYF